MERYTTPIEGEKGYQVKAVLIESCQEGYTGEAINRLAGFENYLKAIEEEQEKLALQLEELKSQNKKNSVRFRELLGKKMMNGNTLLVLQTYGIE